MIIQNMLGDDFENHDFTHRRYRQEWLQVGCICGERGLHKPNLTYFSAGCMMRHAALVIWPKVAQMVNIRSQDAEAFGK